MPTGQSLLDLRTRIMWPLLLLAILKLTQQQDARDYLNYANATLESEMRRSGRFLQQSFYEDRVGHLEEFDFIVVGSGSAGAAIANRLSENDQWTVLLLEVGRTPSFISEIPVIAPLFQFTDYNWGYLMEKQPNVCLGLEDERMHWPRGRVLGGTSVINYMIHVRGNRLDYDRWANLGNPGWSYQDVLPYFIKLENAQVQKRDWNLRGNNGPVDVQDVPFRTESVHAFVKAAQEAGHKYVDYNGADQLGVSYAQSTTKRGLRVSAEKAYLRPIRHRKNLKISIKSRVTKILIDPETREASGVEFVKNRRYYQVRAKKEVIISAGALASPQLLMLSGIGPKNHLEDLGIPVIQDLPVGEKLYDHITFLGLIFTVNQPIVNMQSSIEQPQAFIDLILNGSGPLTGLGGVEALAFLKTNASRDPDNYPDMELIFIGGGLQTDGGQWYRKTFRVSDRVFDRVWGPLVGKNAWSVLPMLVHPRSSGYLRLKSKNPFHWPEFHGNFFTDPENHDIETFIAAIREVQRIARSPAMQKYGAEQVKTPIPGCEGHPFDSDAYWECGLRHITPTLHHQVATCKMGPPEDPEAVVDHKLKVYGVKNLRVADTSVIPIPLTAHTNVPAFMVGERAADLIKEDWIGVGLRPADIK